VRGLLGAPGGAVLGGIAGILTGLAVVAATGVSGFEGESGYVVGFLFMPAGIVLGAIAGGIWLGRRRR
jgi:hypothetical protein